MRTTVMEIDKNKFLSNIDKIKKYTGNKTIMPVIKANGYGTYINKDLSIVNNFSVVAVAIVDEAIALRKLGYQKEIFVLNQPAIEEIPLINEYDITIGLSSIEFLKSIDKKIKVHLEIETGMNRTGIKLDELESFISLIKENKLVEVDGIYTHLSSADNDDEYTNKQLDIFKKAYDIVIKHFHNITYIHSSASNGLLKYSDGISNTVRPGLVMYGYKTMDEMYDLIDVEPIATLKTKISYLKDLNENESVSYSRRFISSKKMKVATIPIGYADGLRRELTNTYVFVNNKKAQIIGTICMDSCMIDVTDIKDIKVGDEVYIFDNKNITLEEIANNCHTINYEVLCTISDRVPRIIK